MKNILKIVFLGVIGFAGLVYLTAPEERISPKKVIDKNAKISIDSLPSHFELVGESKYFRKEKFLTKGNESFLIVSNHDSLVVLNELYKFTDKNVLLIANISKTPWVIKKLAVDGKLEELYKNSKIKIVNDASGDVTRVLNLDDITQTRYFIYKVNKLGLISKVGQGDVKLDALQKGISKEEVNKTLDEISKVIN